MLKQLSKIGMICCLLAIGTSVFAQNESKKDRYAEYPHYGFWSNWSIGAEFSFTKQFDQGGSFALGTGSNFGAGLFFEKELNHVWAIRLHASVPGFMKPVTDEAGNAFDRYGRATIDFKFSFNNAIAGYNPEQRHSIYLVAGAGIVGLYNNEKYGKLATALDAGIGYSYRICDNSTIYIECLGDAIADLPNIFKGNHANLNGVVNLGYMYNFGLTKVDEALASQRSLLTQENFDALNEQVAGLEEQLAISKANEQRLENRVAELENELAAVKKSNSAEADSLRRVIDQIRSEQSKFYALPFSILFGVDQSTVTSRESAKLKAIAQVMKDNEDAKFSIVGYCDYTGSDAYNIKLSQKRAENVKKQLVEKYGIAEDRLSCDWKGKGEAYGDIKLSINRRVAFYRVIE